MTGGSGAQGYNYSASILMGVCEGPATVLNVWKGKAKQSLTDSGMEIMPGTVGQAPWGNLTTNHPTEALGYSGLCLAAQQSVALDSSAGMETYSFEVQGGGILAGQIDAQPDYILADFLTNATYGAGWPAGMIGSLAPWATYCRAAGLFVSPAITDQVQASDFITSLAQATNSQLVWSQKALRLVPYCDATITGNGATFTPDLTPKYDLNDDDFIVSPGDDPLSCTRVTSADAYNHVQVEFCNRANDYNIEIAEARDLADIEAKGLRTQDPIAMHMICDAVVARNVAQLLLQRTLYIRATYSFKLGWRHCLLEPMDLVTITDTAMGLDHAPVRITEIAEDEEGTLTITAEEYPFGVSSTSAYSHQTGAGYLPDYRVDPGASNAPVIFEPPYALAGTSSVWLGTSGGAEWGGCEVWVSIDGASYSKAGTVTGKARHGVTTASLPFGTSPDTIHTLPVSLAVSGGALESVTTADADLLNTLSLVGGELVSYATATLTGANAYSLSYLRRGAYGTTVDVHASGSQFMRLDDKIFKLSLPQNYIGKTLYVKLPAYNRYGTQLQDISTCAAYSYTIRGADSVPLQIGGLTAVAGLASVMLSWTLPADSGLDHVEILRAPADDQNQIRVIGTTSGNGFADMIGVTGVTYYYWVRGVSVAGIKGAVNQLHGTASTTGMMGLTDMSGLIYSAAEIAAGATDLNGVAVTGTVLKPSLFGAAVIGTAAIANAAITHALIGTAAIDTANIASAAITTVKIADAQITTAKIGTAQVQTANIANANVDTLQIKGNAVTVPVSASTAASLYADGTWQDAQSITIDSLGQPVVITASASIVVATYGVLVRLMRVSDSAILLAANFGNSGFQYYSGSTVDASGLTGSQTYKLQFISSSSSSYVSARTITALGCKR
jgi:Putative phage tail protein